MADEDEFEDYDTGMFNSKALDEDSKQEELKAGEKIIPKIKKSKKGKTMYNLKLLLVAPPGILYKKSMDAINLNFEYKASQHLNIDTLTSF